MVLPTHWSRATKEETGEALKFKEGTHPNFPLSRKGQGPGPYYLYLRQGRGVGALAGLFSWHELSVTKTKQPRETLRMEVYFSYYHALRLWLVLRWIIMTERA